MEAETMTKPTNPPGNAPNDRNVPAPKVEMPAELVGLVEQDTNAGISFARGDVLLPRLTILQTNSPECNARNAAHLVGAEPGHWFLRNAIHPIVSGIDGIIVVFCDQQHADIEWRPSRDGFVARHDVTPTDLIEAPNDKGRTIMIRQSNGNIVEHVRELYLQIETPGGWSPYLFSCKSTQHQFARDWMTHFHQYKHPANGQVMPAFARTYRLTTMPTKNSFGNWFAPKYTDLGWTAKDVYAKARAFHQFVKQGKARGDYRGETHDDMA
jgi:hypothetical protein